MIVETWQVQNRMGEASRMDNQKRVVILIQRQAAGELGKAKIAEEILRQSAGRIPPCLG